MCTYIKSYLLIHSPSGIMYLYTAASILTLYVSRVVQYLICTRLLLFACHGELSTRTQLYTSAHSFLIIIKMHRKKKQ